MVRPEFVLAPKVKFHRDEALALARDAKDVWVAKGKKWLRFDAQSVSDEELAAVILGRSATLRAPALRVGTTFIVGFHEEAYRALFDA